jgi:hypothetical protein
MKVFIGKYPKNPAKEQRINVRIDPWDTWSMDHTLAHIIVPMLKQLKATQHGAPYTDDEDVPEELHSKFEVSDDVRSDINYFKRWEWIMNEMIFAFESKLTGDDGLSLFEIEPAEIDWDATKSATDGEGFYEVVWKSRGKFDQEGYEAYRHRVVNGLRLFGKYYEGLWD